MKTKYTVKSPLNHDNELYSEGDPIDLEDKVAKPLLEAGVIEAAAAKTKATGKSE